jgi:hypothetical protein
VSKHTKKAIPKGHNKNESATAICSEQGNYLKQTEKLLKSDNLMKRKFGLKVNGIS